MDELTKFEQYLTYLAGKLQKPTEFAYEVLLRQVYFEGAWFAVWFLVGIGILITAKVKLHPLVKEECDWECGAGFACVFCCFAGVILVLSMTYWLLMIAINPHWYMVKMVGGIVGGK